MTRGCSFVRGCVLLWICALASCVSVKPPEASAHAPQGRSSSGGINRPEHVDKPYLVLISFDGFRADYLDRFHLPNFRRVVQRGARARAMVPVFPTLTFPNHYSLVTGLTAERHGIVGNSFYDPDRQASYSLRDAKTVTDGTWYRGEPIWVTAETQGMVAACYFWPGSEAAIQGVRPTIWKTFDAGIANRVRVDTVLEWLKLPEDRRPHLITLYFNELDSVSHRNALDSSAIERAAQSLDRSLGALLDGINRLPIHNRVYLLLSSDHGMVETSSSHAIRLGSLIHRPDVHVAFSGPVTSLHVKQGGEPAARRIRDEINARLQHGRAYIRSEIPARFRYRADPRVGDVVIVMEESWTVASAPPLRGIVRERWGMHGWDPALTSMHALFAISGPGIQPGVTIPVVDNVDVYPLMAELLGLQPVAGIDGRHGRIRALISKSTATERAPGRGPS